MRNALAGQGPAVPAEAVRATLLVVVNLLASGRSAARAATVQRLLDALNGDRLPDVPSSAHSGRPTSPRSRTSWWASSAMIRSARERPSR